jgi:hypothetical protein
MTSSSRRLGDYPEVMLRNGKAPSLDMLLALVPNEPLLVAEPYESLTAGTGEVIVTRCGDYKIVHRQWRKSDLALRKRFPGLQLGLSLSRGAEIQLALWRASERVGEGIAQYRENALVACGRGLWRWLGQVHGPMC